MNLQRLAPAIACAFVLTSSAYAASATSIEREFVFSPDRVQVTRGADGLTQVDVPGSTREFQAGRPDLPWVGEAVDLPVGMKVTGVEVLALETRAIAEGVRLPSSIVPKPGLGAVERSAPEAAYFSGSAPEPSSPVALGTQGGMRGRSVAWLQMSPVRWTPSSGRLEAVTRLRVRLQLEPGAELPLARERIVPEWETGLLSGASRTATSQSLVSPGREAEPFRPTQIPSVLGSPVQYLIITNETMLPEFQRLADWKTQSGVPAAVRTMSFIRQQYPFGSDDAERVRLFIRDAYTRWGTQWVLLGGDTDVIPTRLASTTFYGGENIACDMYYSCLDGNWNADGDSLYGEGYFSVSTPGDNVDLFPDVYVGRAPTVTQAQAQVFVDKTLQYIKQPAGNYEKRLLFFAEVLFPQDWTSGGTSLDGAELIEEILPMVQSNPSLHYARLYQNYTDARWQPGSLLETRQAVIDSLNTGYNVAVHVGHGYRNIMSVGDNNLTNADASALINGNKLINLYATNCTSNAIDFPSIGEAFVLNPNGGAVTNIGSTRFDFPTAGRSYQREYFTLVFQESVTAVGEAQAAQKLPFIGFSTYDGVNRWTQMTLLLLGDPELRIYTGTPRQFAVTAPTTFAVNETTLAVHVQIGASPFANARVTAYRPGDELVSALTNASGNVTLPFRPDSVGTFTLTVTGFDCKPYQSTITITPAGPPVLADAAMLLEDNGGGGSLGNADGIPDAGETLNLRISVRNNGGSTASTVNGTLSTTDGTVTLVVPTVNYGSLAPGVSANPVNGFRVSVPYNTPDQKEIPFTLSLVDGGGRHYVQNLQVTVHGPDLDHFGHTVQDVGGNGDGKPDPGETVSYFVRLRNLGTGIAQNVVGKLRSLDGLSVVTDSVAVWGDINAAQESQGDALTFVPSSASAKLQLEISDLYGVLWTQLLDLSVPSTPTDLLGTGAATSIKLTWSKSPAADLLGYNLYRSLTSGGPFTKINPIPTERTAYFQDSGLGPLTRYYYKVSAVDSSGNESAQSAAQSASTNPPLHAIFPVPMGRQTPSPVAIDHMYTGYPVAIATGADYIYVWHPDGSAPVDADESSVTSGDFTMQGSYYAGGVALDDLDGGDKEVVGASWETFQLFAYDRFGGLKAGWPVGVEDPVWAAPVIADLNNDGQKEVLIVDSPALNENSPPNGGEVYAFRANGTEWRDGDSNPGTVGVFKSLPSSFFNPGTPAVVDLDGNGQKDIIYGAGDGQLYAWRPDGTNLPGFPVTLNAGVTSSVAVGYLDGVSDTQLDIVVGTSGDQLYAVQANGVVRSGFPIFVKMGGTSKSPSPVIADMNNDGFADILIASTNGGVYVWNRNGILQFPWNGKRYSALTTFASECSPVVSDINGDGTPDVVMGDEAGQLAALSGVDGSMMAGFPIQLDGEVRGAPALCDCDGDGKTEIVVSGWDKNLYMWDYDFPFSPNKTPQWPQFHHDAARTGATTTPVLVDVEGPAAPVTAVEFAAPTPNPARGGTRFAWAIPASRAGETFELAVYDLAGRLVRTIGEGPARAGRHTAEWDLRNRDGGRAGDGVYFARLSVGSEVRSQKLIVLR